MTTLVRLAVRLHRRGLIACGLLLAFFAAMQGTAYARIAGDTAASRRAFAAQMELVGRQLTYMLPLPERLDTLAGFVQWRAYGTYALIVAFWAAIAAAGATRGDEEAGLTEQWLATPRSRTALLVSRLAGYAAVLALVVAGAVATTALGARGVGEPIPLDRLALQGAALFALGVCCFALVAAVAQFVPTRRAASGVGGGALLALFLLNGAGRTQPALASARRASPFYYYDQAGALVPGAPRSLAPTLALALGAAALVALACAAFARRDLGAAALRARHGRSGARVETPSRNPLLRVPVLAGLWEQRSALLVWALGVAAGGAFFAGLARSMSEMLRTAPALRGALEAITRGTDASPAAAFISLTWFGALALVLALFAVTQTARWSAEDLEGRLEMVLATPTSRRRVVIERFATLLAATALIVALGATAVALSAARQGITLPLGRFVLANALLVPLTTSFAAVGAAGASVAPRAAAGVVSAVAVASYLLQSFGVMLRWPDWLRNLSAFELYGSPMFGAVRWGGLTAMVAATLIGFALATIAIERRDIGR